MATGIDFPFDVRHELDPQRAHNRESLVWVVTDPEQHFGLVGYTWVDAHGIAGSAGIAFGSAFGDPVFHRVDGLAVPASDDFAAWTAGPLTAEHAGPQRAAQVRYDSPDLALDFAFEPFGDPYAYTSHPDPFPRYFADERLEQGGRVSGTARVGDRELVLDAFGHRDHSWGARDWGSVLHYKWLNFLADGISVHVQDVQGLGRSDVRGYVHKDGTTAAIVRSSFSYGFDAAFVHRDLVVTFEDDEGRTTRAAVTRADPGDDFTYPIDPRLTLVDVIGHAEVDGVPGAAYVEMAWPPGYVEHGRAVRQG